MNARDACLEAFSRWERTAEFADDILHGVLEHARLNALDRAFVTEAFYGLLRRLAQVDFVLGKIREEPLDEITRRIVKFGIYQLFFMRVPHHAAVNETVNLARKGRSLVNALLRRVIREMDALQAALKTAPNAVRHSHPGFLVERWQQEFGTAETAALCEWNNQPSLIFVRTNTLKVTRCELLRTTEFAQPHPAHPLMLEVKGVPLPWLMQGLCYVQDPSTLLACELLDAQPGERVLDACAAPGGKTSYLAQLMRNTGEIVACDSSSARLHRLRENLARLGVQTAHILQQDWQQPAPDDFCGGEKFDRILVDAPCSNTGVIRRRVDVRWRLQAADFQRMPYKQFALVRNLAPLLKRGGVLVYSTCSLEPEENRLLAARIAAEIPSLELFTTRRSLPFADGIDGAFAAKFIKR
jgi:16S rRNA (cytosine967-C5)-methyltransferase